MSKKLMVLSRHRSLILLASIIVIAFAEITWLNVVRYRGYNVRAYDLGVMSQAIWSATQGQPLIFTIEGIALSRLARHVELFYFLLAPLYALWPTPLLLSGTQALLYAIGAVPLYRLTRRRLQNAAAALVVVIIYLFYPVAQTAVLFDLHGDTLAMPFLFFVIEALDRKAWRSYAIWLVLALSCKFYVAGLVGALGGILWLRGERRAGLLTALTGLIWGVVTFWGIRALFAPPEAAQVQATTVSYLQHYFGDVQAILETGNIRVIIGLIVYLPVLLLGWRSLNSLIWVLLASIIAIPTLLSTGPGPSYDYRYHHYALAVPFLITAIVYGAETLRRQQETQAGRKGKGLPWGVYLGVTLIITLTSNALFVDTPLNIYFYNPPAGSARGLDTAAYKITSRDRFKDTWLAQTIPPQGALATNDILVPHVVNRKTLYLTRDPSKTSPKTLPQLLTDVEYVVVDALFDFVIGNSKAVSVGGVNYELEAIKLLLDTPNFQLQKTGDGLLLFGRATSGLSQKLTIEVMTESPPLQGQFGDLIGLVKADIDPLGQNRFRLHFDWLPLGPLAENPPLFAVSELAGRDHSRIAHLPTRVLHPTSSWQPNQIVRESFEGVMPNDLPAGTYSLSVGWYNSESVFAPLTDERSRIGEQIEVGLITIP